MTVHPVRRHPMAVGVCLAYASVVLLLSTPLSLVAGGPPYLAGILLVAGLTAMATATALCTQSLDEVDDVVSTHVHLEVRRGLREAERYANHGR